MSAIMSQQSDVTQNRISYLDAIVKAQIEEMERDERVIMMGEDIAIYGSGDLLSRFGADRIWATPISETSFTGMGIGAAIAGLRPIVDLSIASFMYLASDQIINQAAKLRYMTGGQVTVPIVFRCCMYYGVSVAAQHSDRPYPLFLNVPGLTVICPSSPTDAKGLLKAAIRSDDPVIFFEDMKSWTLKENVPADLDHLVPIGKADIKREGSDVTIVAIGGGVRLAMEAAKVLAEQGISAEIVDPRTLKPLDMETIIRSIAKTGRLMVVESAHRMCNLGAEIVANVCEEAFECLKKPVRRISAPDVQVPFSPALESMLFPRKEQIVAAAKELL